VPTHRRGSRFSKTVSRNIVPGNYVYFDRTQVALGAGRFDDCALSVLATVVSKPARNRIILDSGSKTLTNDGARGILTGHRDTASVVNDQPADRTLVGRTRHGDGGRHDPARAR
jgi:D-serine deaminase-like pyridoxal phosphate-dependent protein